MDKAQAATNIIAITIVRGLNTRCHSVQPTALVAVASAPASIIRASGMLMRPCTTAPRAHCVANRAANHAVLWASGALSACHKNTETPASSSTNCTQANPVSYTHLRAHETVLDLVCRLLLEKKKKHTS